ncbi:hypothetical protein [Zunongwangia sp. HGR-M22]|uniref:hypothetical protein n=1 Tax=Zunongwangia sp. HGR-M22 TaxID=3015168 RepID=UPI0022DDA005|nr:hypothetical protein [Zunongwangia sp. HGR-M22]WBL25087.1 hypothetical protein PBT91_14435 [Zunongwangia sp. HGR-M22]
MNKSQFEKSLSVSTGYLKLTEKRQSQPGTELIIEFSKKYSDICLKWLLTGEGEMMKSEAQNESKDNPPKPYQGQNDISNLELRKDLHAISQGMIKNFETISEGVFETLKGQQKILGFIEELKAADIASATKNLSDFLAKN